MSIITLTKGEGKWLFFTIKKNDVALDVSSATFSFVVKSSLTSSSYLIEKNDASFIKTSATSGIVSVNLSASDTAIDAGKYLAQLKTTLTASTDVDKSNIYDFILEETVFN